ncbi:MAG: hypothetical protein KY410_08435 [Proteobacteria bacterium]|nr:hypothetical protein [Pseudomonadota bacterium]
MSLLKKIFLFTRGNGDELQKRLEQALHSLRARGSIESFELGRSGAQLQGGRGNFGMQLDLERNGVSWQLISTPITNPAGPFSESDIAGEILPMPYWVSCGKRVVLERVQRMRHLELVDWIRDLETRHPAADWLGVQFRRLAEGERPSPNELQGIVLLGVRRFIRTIPSSDRLHETIEPALVTLLRMQSKNGTAKKDEDVFESEDHAAALLQFIQETHPLEAKRAVHRLMMAR